MHFQRNAGSYLDRAEDIGPLMSQARRLLELRQTVMRLLPEALSRSCTVANARQGRVVMYAANSVMAAKLKLHLPALRNQLMQAGQEVTSVTVQVQPPSGEPAPPATGHVLSVSAAESLTALAERLPDSPLNRALRDLANRSRK